MKPLKAEITAIAKLLTEGAETPEALASAVIEELDKVRAQRVTYAAILRFGSKGNCFFTGFAPYSTTNQAKKAIEKHPAAGMATAYAVVPVVNDIGLDELIARVDAPPKARGDFVAVAADAAAFARGERPKR
ncbi:MAG TPA: hypothetical protein VFH56_14295 [Acidimicrobiales bacterium]|nr:hypothetical protein [Acidimicrobiales bacterium]